MTYTVKDIINIGFSEDDFNFSVKECIENDEDILTPELAREAFEYDEENVKNILKYSKNFPNFYLDPYYIEYEIENKWDGFKRVVNYYIKINKNALNPKLLEKFIEKIADEDFKHLLRYCKHFPEFKLDSDYIEYVIFNETGKYDDEERDYDFESEEYYYNFEFLIDYYIEINKNELTLEFAEKCVNFNLRNFRHLIRYCKHFLDFYLNPKLAEFAVTEMIYNLKFLLEYYMEIYKRNLTLEIIEFDQEILKRFVKNNYNNFIILLKYYIQTDKQELNLELAKYSIKKSRLNFKGLLNYATHFSNFNVDPNIFLNNIIFNYDNSMYLVNYYIKTNKNELITKVAKEVEFSNLLRYFSYFKIFSIDDQIIIHQIKRDKYNFIYLLEFYIENNVGKLTIELTNLAIDKYPISSFIYLLNYCRKFPEFDLITILSTSKVTRDFEPEYEKCYKELCKYYKEMGKPLPEELTYNIYINCKRWSYI